MKIDNLNITINMKLLITSSIKQLPSQEHWNNYITSGSGGMEISTHFIAGMEQAFSSDFLFRHIAIYNDNEALVFCCPMYIASNINLEIVLTDNWLKKIIYYWRKFDRNFLLPKVIFVGTPLNDELDIVMNFQEKEEYLQLFINQLIKLQKDYDISLIIFKNLIENSKNVFLQKHGFFRIKSLSNSIINCNFTSFEKFLISLDTRKRRNINSKLRKAQEVGYEVQTKLGKDLDVDNVFPLFENNYLKSQYKFERLNIGLFRYLIEKLDKEIIWINILENNYPIASAWCYVEKDSLVMKRVGIDYSSSIPFLYFILHYETIKYAIKNHLKFLKLGPTAYEAKKEMGAHLQTTYLFIKHENLVFNKLLQLFYNTNFEYNWQD
jgi:predicted N-acyltransferase